MVNVVDLIKQFIENLMNDPATAAQFAGDPMGVMAAQGISEEDLSGVDVYQLAGEVCSTGDVPEGARSAWQGYSSGSSSTGGGYTPAPAGPAPANHSVEHVVQQLQTVTYVTYQDDHSITQTIIDNSVDNSIDNSVDFDVSGDVHGDIDVDVDNANAVGDGSVATAGENNDVNAATGDQAQVIDGDNYGQANTGDGAVQAFGDINAPVNTGTNTGIIADGDVENAVVGDGNTVTQVQNEGNDAVFGFGEGDVTTQENNINNSTLNNSNVGNEQGEGDLYQDASQKLEIDLGRGDGRGDDHPDTMTRFQDDAPDPVFAPQLDSEPKPAVDEDAADLS